MITPRNLVNGSGVLMDGTWTGIRLHGVRATAVASVPFGTPRPSKALTRERRYTGEGDPRSPGGRIDPAALPSTCWCEAEVVTVTAEDVRAGRTSSCGASACRAPETTRRRTT